MAKSSEADANPTSLHRTLLGDTNAQKRRDNEPAAFGAAFQGTPRHDGPITPSERVRPDLEGAVDVLWSAKGLDPEIAWGIAISGNTAARMVGTRDQELYAGVTNLLARAAAYSWWPKKNLDGGYVAVPLDQWIAEGHPFTPKIPHMEVLLDRWGFQPVLINANPTPSTAVESVD